MVKLRFFLSNYSPMFALAAVVVCLYVMAICIGVGISLRA